MGRDSATFRENGTEVPSLSRDKGTTGQAQNLATGWDGTGFASALVPRQRDTGTRKFICSGTSRPVETLVEISYF